uniref:Uncharacterized protein n=1 Tax=Manihot esculenta TaxID=3983 RepID=A0A2C9WCA2_MANES
MFKFKMRIKRHVVVHEINRLSSRTQVMEKAEEPARPTSHPHIFSFSEILAVSSVLQLEGTENSAQLHLLRLFDYGTWRDYTILKLKQLTVVTLAESNKALLSLSCFNPLIVFYVSFSVVFRGITWFSHDALEVSSVHELEDFLINDCIYRVYTVICLIFNRTMK